MADTVWTLIAGMLVFFMNLGFGCVESGFCRAKNCVNILSKNFIVFAATSIGFLLLGFGLIKGRSDIGQLERGWAVAVGWLLLLSLLIGAVGALALLHAAHGRPRVISLEEVLPGQLADHDEARRAARRLRQGIVMTLACTALLVAAVALVAAEEGLPGKPEPDTFLAAAERLGVQPERTVVVEDAIAGVEAGWGGGFGLVIGVNREVEQAEENRQALSEHGAHVVVDDLGELLAEGEG